MPLTFIFHKIRISLKIFTIFSVGTEGLAFNNNFKEARFLLVIFKKNYHEKIYFNYGNYISCNVIFH